MGDPAIPVRSAPAHSNSVGTTSSIWMSPSWRTESLPASPTGMIRPFAETSAMTNSCM